MQKYFLFRAIWMSNLFAAIFISNTALAVTQDIQNSIVADIKKAQQQLHQTENLVTRQRAQMAKRLNSLEQDVLELRKKTAVNRRLADENTLSLTQLEERQQRWKEQTQYQQNLLNRFLQQHTLNTEQQNAVSSLLSVSQRLQQRFYPQWQEDELVTPSGELQNAQTLTVGPVIWFWQNEVNKAGIAQTDNGNLIAGYDLGDDAGVSKLFNDGHGLATFDPSLNRAMARAQQSETAIEHVSKGGIWAIPIILFALFAIAIAIVKSVQLWRLPKVVPLTPSQMQALHANQNSNHERTQAMGDTQQRLLEISRQTAISQERDDQLFAQLLNTKHSLDRWLGAIAITASVSPLLGLLGTVSGMIETFKMMTLFGAGDPEVVSGGIAQALITTELGLVVAIPALILNALLSRKAKNYYHEIESFAIQLSQIESKPLPFSLDYHDSPTIKKEELAAC